MPDEVLIRPATPADLEAITAIYNEAIATTTATFDTEPKTLEEQRVWFEKHGPRHPVLVAELDGRVTGWASLTPWSDRCAYRDTAETSAYVKSEYRGKGVGRRLKAALIEEARRLGFHTLLARIAEGSDASLHINRSMGFVPVGLMREVGMKFGKRLGVHLLQLILSPEGQPPSGAASLYCVDAFANRPFEGNPAGVCLLDRPVDERWMQSLAAEMNLAETAFVRPVEDGFSLRWFTPRVEVELCGHATLASAHVLWEQHRVARDQPIAFHTLSGTLLARPRDGLIELDFPSRPAQGCEEPAGLSAALAVAPVFVGRSKEDYLIEVDSEVTLRQVAPDFQALGKIDVRGVIVTARGDGNPYDFVSRFFAPAVGINEDPVTGSAHCTLAPFWSERLGQTSFRAYQASSRGGELQVTLAGDRVLLAGKAVTVYEASVSLPT
jgi:predicted PhzF superfamily epimerase YddE/YHI9/L-amino acid N-acyltransferase YncA